MTLAKCILSQNVYRVRVCKRFHPPPGTARSLRADEVGGFMAGGLIHGSLDMELTVYGRLVVSSRGGTLQLEADLPDDTGKFAGDGDLDFVVMHEPLLELHEAAVETVLGLP